MRKAIPVFLIISVLLMVSCNLMVPGTATSTPLVLTTPVLTQTATAAPTRTTIPSLTATTAAAPTQTPAEATATTGAPTVTGTPESGSTGTATATTVDISAQKYIDDRSGPVQLMASLYNAINRREYLRAYSYWETNSSMQGTTFEQYQAGYEKTDSVELIVGVPTGDAGAGNFYYTLPVGMTAKTTDGVTQKYIGCYQLHLANPGVQGTLPFRSLGIQKGKAYKVAIGTDLSTALGDACKESDGFVIGGSNLGQWTFNQSDISANHYVDDRSNPVQVVLSYFNAINRFEYLRAYSYWEPDYAVDQLPSLEKFSQGYENTQSVQVTTGEVSSDAGAGQYHYQVPVTLVATTKDGKTQTYVGCYELHISNPSIQAAPPFAPLGFRSAVMNQVANDANTSELMKTACQ